MSTTQKPWGYEHVSLKTDACAFKQLFVYQGKRLSRQRHKSKKEVWLVVSGKPWVECGDFAGQMKPGDFVVIKPGTVHRLSAPNGNVTVWEMQCGDDADIERLEDDYGRKD